MPETIGKAVVEIEADTTKLRRELADLGGKRSLAWPDAFAFGLLLSFIAFIIDKVW